MKKHNPLLFAFTAIVYLLSLVLVGGTTAVQAMDSAAEENDPIIVLESYEITGEVVVPGEKFDMTINLHNSSTTRKVKSVMLTITNPTGATPAYSTVSQQFLGDFAPNETKSVSLAYLASKNLISETITFGVTITSSSNSNFVYVTAPVEVDHSPFRVLNKNIPEKAMTGERVTASVYFKTNNVDDISNMVMVATLQGEQVASSNIGNMTSGATKTQDVSFVVYNEGSYDMVVFLKYVDGYGSDEKFILYEGQINVEQHEEVDQNTIDSEPVSGLTGFSAEQLKVMAVCAGLILILGAGTVLLVIKYNR